MIADDGSLMDCPNNEEDEEMARTRSITSIDTQEYLVKVNVNTMP